MRSKEEKVEEIQCEMITRTDIQSSLTPSYSFPQLRIEYPEVVMKGLAVLYEEYNRAFSPLVGLNREWESDYRYCFRDGVPINVVVQIDMVGLTSRFMEDAASREDEDGALYALRSQIFEIENSWALYQLLGRICERDGKQSSFSIVTRAVLDDVRLRFGMPVALLAVTREKYAAMRATEFGKAEGEPLSDAEVGELSGFDTFFGPDEFRRHVAEQGMCKFLLYVRASDPVEKLKRPEVIVDHPLLTDPGLRRIIKEYSLTFNIDNPEWSATDPQRINDTKRYMPAMGMACEIVDETGFRSAGFAKYLRSVGIHPAAVADGKQVLRAKPAQGTYGCYGHVRGLLSDQDFRRRVRRGMRDRGAYLVQPEHEAPMVVNTVDGRQYAYIDRVFFGMTNSPQWLGGFREFLPADSQEVRSGRLHGNRETVFAEIVP